MECEKYENVANEYIRMCSNDYTCKDCKYENVPCQLMFGYDKGRTDMIEKCISLPIENIFGVEYIRKSDIEQLKKGV